MGCNCGKNKSASKSNKIVKPQVKPLSKQKTTLKRIIRRSAY